MTLVGTIRSRGTITVPAELRDQLGLQEGDQVAFEVAGDRLIVTPLQVVPRAQAWFWTQEWQAAERAADADQAAGRFTRYDSDEDFLTSLTDE